MVLKRTIPDHRYSRPSLAKTGSMAGVVWVVASLSGCPYRAKEIRITDTGAGSVLAACMSQGGGGGFGSGSGGGGFPPPPPGGGGPFDDSCSLTGHYSSDFTRIAPQARLFLVSPSDNKVQDASKCMHLKPCSDSGRSGGPQPNCIASDINQQLDGAMPNGLSFAGLKSSEDAQLMLAFYFPAETTEDDEGCHRGDLFACAGLAAPLGGGSYDITCASCQGGSRTAYGSNTGPCPKGPTGVASCFLKICDGILASNNYE
jgi:hypothetical protein